jgi:hypothetical protein
MAEIESYADELRWILSEIVKSLEEMDAEERAQRPLPTGNDANTIARHVVGSVRAYAVGIGGARPVPRDRIGEFEPADDDDALIGRLRALADEIDESFSTIAEDELDLPGSPLAEWRGRTPPTGTRRDSILGAMRHAAIHLGELRLTADLVARASKGDEA